MNRIVACIPGFKDEELLGDCLDSVRSAGMSVIYADGAYALFLRPTLCAKHAREAATGVDVYALGRPDTCESCGPSVESWRGDEARARQLVEAVGGRFIPAPSAGPWPGEAEKRQALFEAAYDAGAEYALFLDVDERVEIGPDIFNWLDRSGDVGLLRLYQAGNGELILPRLLRLEAGLEFRGPRDFDVYRGSTKIAWPGMRTGGVEIPRAALCIRHERVRRSEERHRLAGEYYCRRRAAHPVCA